MIGWYGWSLGTYDTVRLDSLTRFVSLATCGSHNIPFITMFLTEKSRVQSPRIMNSVSRSSATASSGSSRVTYPKATQRSVYSDHWEPYIAANLHLYTVPLALFLRRSRELDFSPREYQRSLNTVRRVFRVFSPQVVAVINKLLHREAGSKWSTMVDRHEQNLGAFCPPKCERGLASCQYDMQNLLEEIYLQHTKKIDSMDFLDRWIAKLENPFGGGAFAGEEKEIEALISQAKVIVNLPKEFEVVPLKVRTPADSQGRNVESDAGADRTPNGLLSEIGRERISTGTTKCNALEIGYVGDRLFSRPRSHEIAWLVPILVHMSVYLNTQFGIPGRKDDNGFDYDEPLLPRRFNLRFLAEYRNLVFLVLCYGLMKLIWG